MTVNNLDENEIAEIRKILENILSKDLAKKEYLVNLLLKWFKNKGLSSKNLIKIMNPFAKILDGLDCKKIISDICNTYGVETFADTIDIDEDLINFLTQSEGRDNAIRIILTLKSLLPQKNQEIQGIPPYLDYGIYGILSYDGPVIAICDFERRQIVKGYIITREDVKGRQYKAIRIGEVLVEACPINVIIYEDDSAIDTKFEIEWLTYMGKTIIIGPATLTEIISILKQKSLVLNAATLETSLIAIFRSFVEADKVEFRGNKEEMKCDMDLRKWISE